ncbi:hypothetical protein [Paenibacillus azoreducens]|uniref:Uncharacterized protein n=1 Tax=Paenibacillus azoreducens TaxID=116718 RepID=A0A919YAG2_9BACL|nr:hypothetical protein [Paenibacillus azoreducens]GIO47612.1 hypothetical protein J34TS1_23770 [Paenibacillus azoreducens]
MSTELSRVETYSKKRKKNYEKKPPLSAPEGQPARTSKPKRERIKPSASLSRVRAKGRRNDSIQTAEDEQPQKKVSSASGMSRSRTERHKAEKETGVRREEDPQSTPSRAEKYGARKNILSKYFTNSLFFLFLVLTAFLVYWGIKGAPPLGELW